MTTSTPRPEPGRTLRELAEAGRLANHQLMDRPTLDRIARNRPAGARVPASLPHPPAPLIPDATWFARTETASSIHGVLHGARVAALLQLLAHHHRIDPARARTLAAAAACHDCRRLDDCADPGHGRRAADWLTAHGHLVTAALGTPFAPEAITAVALHDVPHEAFTGAEAEAYRRHRLAVDLLKAADALDRYRLPLARWWPDLRRLRLPVPDWAPPLAHDLVVRSERARLNGATDARAIELALHTVLPE
ncbi:hypothetical protein GCM10009639_41050 [Kitasatospora putterlickiae]|uniref:HD domain-containing protein n=1 Tax=Kitasatospora putterlickiae TaxID=221725 RepID=A0ABN1Y9V9_9ACTN